MPASSPRLDVDDEAQLPRVAGRHDGATAPTIDLTRGAWRRTPTRTIDFVLISVTTATASSGRHGDAARDNLATPTSRSTYLDGQRRRIGPPWPAGPLGLSQGGTALSASRSRHLTAPARAPFALARTAWPRDGVESTCWSTPMAGHRWRTMSPSDRDYRIVVGRHDPEGQEACATAQPLHRDDPTRPRDGRPEWHPSELRRTAGTSTWARSARRRRAGSTAPWPAPRPVRLRAIAPGPDRHHWCCQHAVTPSASASAPPTVRCSRRSRVPDRGHRQRRRQRRHMNAVNERMGYRLVEQLLEFQKKS